MLTLLFKYKYFIIFIVMGFLIGFQQYRIMSLQGDIKDLEHRNEILNISNQNLTSSIDVQNQAIDQLNEELEAKNDEVNNLADILDEQYQKQLEELENQHKDANINNSEQAIEWLRDRKYF